jgi:hypothetical protein
MGHSGVSTQLFKPVHVTSHAHDSLHLIRRLHEPVPLHETSHGA